MLIHYNSILEVLQYMQIKSVHYFQAKIIKCWKNGEEKKHYLNANQFTVWQIYFSGLDT